MRIVGIAGHARAGKDTIANWLSANREFVRYSFAAPIKYALSMMFGIPREHWDGPEKEQPIEWLGKSPRELAQTLGTEWGRKLVHPEVWTLVAEHAFKWVTEELEEKAPEGGELCFVIPDVRFENEADLVRRYGQMIHVYRDGANGNVGVIGHESERGVEFKQGDVLISNNGTIEELHGKLGALFPSRP